MVHRGLSAVAAEIVGKAVGTPTTLQWQQLTKTISAADDILECFRQLVKEKISAVRAIQLDEETRELARTCPDRPSVRQILHLAALAWIGDFTTLMDYDAAFAKGRRLNFVPMITRDMIKRAISIAADQAVK